MTYDRFLRAVNVAKDDATLSAKLDDLARLEVASFHGSQKDVIAFRKCEADVDAYLTRHATVTV